MNIGRVGGRLIAGVVAVLAVLSACVGHASAADGDITEFHLDTKFGISDVQSMIAGPDGNLWFPVTDGIGDHFGRLTPSGVYTEFKIQGPAARQVIVGPDGAIWFAQWGGAEAALGRMTTDGVYTRFPLAEGAVLNALTVGPDGAIWFTELSRSRVGRYDIKSGVFEFFDLAKSQPNAIISFAGSLWIGDVYPNTLYRMSTTGAIEDKLTIGFGVTDFAVNKDVLWIGGGTYNLIARLNADKQGITTVPLKYSVSRFAFDSLGNLWIADGSGAERASMHRLDPRGSSTDYPIPARYGSAGAIALGPDDQIWFIESRFAESPSFPGTADNIIGRALTGAPIRTKPAPAQPTAVVSTVHRSVFTAIIELPDTLTAKNIVKTAWVTPLVAILILFPTNLFNSTAAGRYERIFKGRQNRDAPIWRRPPLVTGYFAIVVALFTLHGVGNRWLHPPVQPPSYGRVVADGFVGFGIGLFVMVVIANGVAAIIRRSDLRGARLEAKPATLPLALACVAISILIDFSPGFVYGLIVGLAAPRPLEPREQSRHISQTTAAIAIAAIIAWRLQLEFSTGSRPWIVAAGIFVAGIETATLGLIPLRFLPGYTLRAWHPWRWGVLWGIGLVLFVLGILAPGVSRPGPLNSTTTWIVIAAFNAASLAFWFQNARADKAETISLARLFAAGLGKTAAPEVLTKSSGAPAESSRPVG